MRPRILLVPTLTELEWAIRPQLEEWADVASYDGPGVGAEPPVEGDRIRATAQRGLAELDRRGWDRCLVAADELGVAAAALVAQRRPRAVAGLVLGHPIVSLDFATPAPSLNEGVARAHVQLAGASFPAFVREQMRAWVGLYGRPASAGDELAKRYLERVTPAVAPGLHAQILAEAERNVAEVRLALIGSPAIPKLLIHHEGCLLFTRDGFDEAVAAMPGAEIASLPHKPSIDPAASALFRAFAERHGG